MRDLEQARAEVFRRSEEKIKERTRMRRRALTMCVPLVLCLVIGAVTAPMLLRDGRSNTAVPTAQETREVGPDSVANAAAREYAFNGADEASLLLQSYAPQDTEDDKKIAALPGEVKTAPNGVSPAQPSVVGETVDGASYDNSGTPERRVTVTTPEGEIVYIIEGDMFKCETEGWERRLTEEEASELYEALEQPEEDGR